VGVQFKCKGDRVTLLARDSLESTAPLCLDRGDREQKVLFVLVRGGGEQRVLLY
jgi:hypothetical protein